MKEVKKTLIELGSIVGAGYLFFDILLMIESGKVLHRGWSTISCIVILLLMARTVLASVCEIGRIIKQKYDEIWKEEKRNICICETKIDEE